MKKGIALLLILLLVLVPVLAGCEQGNDPETAAEAENAEAGSTEQPSDEEASAEAEEDTTRVFLFVMNSDGTGFDRIEENLIELTPDALVQALLAENGAPAGTAVNSFSMSGNMADLDLNAAFQEGVNSMGSTGEYYTIGAMVNTFLEAYGAQFIRIRIDGAPLTSPHRGEMDRYLEHYE